MRISPKPQPLVAALLSLAVLLAGLALAAQAAAPVKINNCNRLTSRPKQLTLACGDANTSLTGLTWSSFGGASAQGRGMLVLNTCEPNCANGKDRSYAVKVTASAPGTCRGGARVYNRLALQFSGPVPGPGVPRSFKLGCPR